MMEKLEEYGYIDDRRLARSVVRGQFGGKGRRKNGWPGRSCSSWASKRKLPGRRWRRSIPGRERENALMWARELWPRLEGNCPTAKRNRSGG